MSVKPECGGGVIFNHCSYGKLFNVKYLEIGDRYDVGVKVCQTKK